MRFLRAGLLLAAVMATLLSIDLSASPRAEAGSISFCNRLVYPNTSCPSRYEHPWQRVRARYPGSQSDNVTACVFLQNWSHNLGLRDGRMYCDRTWSSPTWNPMGHNYGSPFGYYWEAYVYLPSGQPAHTLVGWASDNQTDG
jgi:hypothetical protein